MDSALISQLLVLNSTLICYLICEEKQRKRTSCHVSPYLLDRNTKGRFETDFLNMAQNPKVFQENFHMSVENLEKLFEMVKFHLSPRRLTRKDLISPKQKLAIVLEFLASGDVQRHVTSCYRVSQQHFGKIIDDVCDAIIKELKFEMPQWNQSNMQRMAKEFEQQWNFPNCVGAVDGKHVRLRSPKNSGSLFYNYKGFFSLVILAICDANYRFTYLDIGAYGSEGDANVFRNSSIGSRILQNTMFFPEDTEFCGTRLPYFIVGDDAFPLSKRIMKPYGGRNLSKEERVFNYRLSRARRCIENAFGILSWKWICLQKGLLCKPDRAQKIITACCLLHNFLLENGSGYSSQNNMPNAENEFQFPESVGLSDISQSATGRSSDQAKYVRNTLKNFFNSPSGSLSWQENAAH